MQIFQHADYRTYLKSVLTERIQKNAAYSLRAFARHLDISAAQLSQVFSGQRHLSYESGLKVGQNLGLSAEEVEFLCLLIQSTTTKDSKARNSAIQRMSAMNQDRPTSNLSLDAFRAIADWYHIPILEMTDLPKSEFTARKIASRLGILPIEASTAIDRLLRLELLEKTEDGRYRRVYVDGLFQSEHANLGLNHFHKKMLEHAQAAIEGQKNAERLIGSETFAMDPAQMGEFKKIAERFFSRAQNLARTGRKRSEIYHLGVQLFRVTRKS